MTVKELKELLKGYGDHLQVCFMVEGTGNSNDLILPAEACDIDTGQAPYFDAGTTFLALTVPAEED
jgi:hypothetical protein